MAQESAAQLFTVDEAAAALRVDVSTVRRMLKRGELDAFQTSERGHWRIRRDADGLPRLVPAKGRAA